MKVGKRANAKKYEALREKQAKANALVLESRSRLKKGHKATKTITAMKKAFYDKRGVKSTGRLSFKNLDTKDLKAYETLLDAIISEQENNVYLNPQKYQQFRDKMTDIFNEQWQNKNVSVDDLIDIVESDVVQQLKDLGIVYKEVFDKFRDEPTMTTEDVINALDKFLDEYDDNNVTVDDFLVFTDDYITLSVGGYDIDTYLPIYRLIPEYVRDTATLDAIIKFYIDSKSTSLEDSAREYIGKYV